MEACRGRCSENLTPGMVVWMVEKGPRTSAGASGLGSHISIWLGPPESQNNTTAFFLLPGETLAAGEKPAKGNAAKLPNPVCKNHLREPTLIPVWGNFMIDIADSSCSLSCNLDTCRRENHRCNYALPMRVKQANIVTKRRTRHFITTIKSV